MLSLSPWATDRPQQQDDPHLQALSSLSLLFASTRCSRLFGSLHNSGPHKGAGWDPSAWVQGFGLEISSVGSRAASC